MLLYIGPESSVGSIVGGVIGGIIFLLLLLAMGIVIVVVTLVMRSRGKRSQWYTVHATKTSLFPSKNKKSLFELSKVSTAGSS